MGQPDEIIYKGAGDQGNGTRSFISPGGYDLIIAFYDVAVNSPFKITLESNKVVTRWRPQIDTYRSMGTWCHMLLRECTDMVWDKLSRDSIM